MDSDGIAPFRECAHYSHVRTMHSRVHIIGRSERSLAMACGAPSSRLARTVNNTLGTLVVCLNAAVEPSSTIATSQKPRCTGLAGQTGTAECRR